METPATLDELNEHESFRVHLQTLAEIRQAALDAAAARIDLERVVRRASNQGVPQRAIALASGFSPAGIGKLLRRKGNHAPGR